MIIFNNDQLFSKGHHALAAWSELLPDNTLWTVKGEILPAGKLIDDDPSEHPPHYVAGDFDREKFVDLRDIAYHGVGPFWGKHSNSLRISEQSLWNVILHHENTGENILAYTLGTIKHIVPNVVWTGIMSDVRSILETNDPLDTKRFDIKYGIQRYYFLLGRVSVNFVGGYK